MTVPALMLASAPNALAFELDTLLPAGIPGFGTGPDITVLSRLQKGYQSQGVSIDGVTISQMLDAAAGYDSAPNGTGEGSPTLLIAPSLQIGDAQAGFGAYFGLQTNSYPEASGQNITDYTIGAGEAAIFSANTLILGAALLHNEQSGFELEPVINAKPTSITGTEVRVGDDATSGMLIISPEISAIRAVSNGAEPQKETEISTGLKLQIIPDGVLHLIMYIHATNLSDSNTAQNATNYTGLIGLSDTEEGLWDFRLGVGFTSHCPAIGKPSLLPVIEFAASWMPDELTSFDFSAAHEVDDPERIDTASYTLTETKFSVVHEYLRNVLLTANASVTHAAFFAAPLIETIAQAQAQIAWKLSADLKLSGTYIFNDRQANHLRTANEHIASVSLAWTL